MCSLESLKIDLKGLSEAKTIFEYNLGDSYFEALEASEVSKGSVHVIVCVQKSSGVYELTFHTEGTVTIPCDKCLDDMEQPVSTDNRLLVKYGVEHAEDDDLVTLAEDEESFNVAWLIYEFIVLGIPIKHVHRPGECNPAMIKALEEHSSTRSSDEGEEKPIDPRWDQLKNLKV